MDSPIAPTSSPSDCFTAQTIPQLFGNQDLNPDVGGAAVAISNIVINIALPILLRWSESGDDVQTTVLMLLSQVYPIMAATAMSINTNNLSLFDAHFAVAVTASPVSVYLAYSSVCSIFGYKTKIFTERDQEPAGKMSWAKRAIQILGLLLPVIWLCINLVISFYPRAFRNSPENCQSMTITGWFEFQTVSNFIGVLDVMGRRDLWNDLQGRGGLGAISLITMWIWAIYVVRHRHDIYDRMRIHWKEQKLNGKHKNLLMKLFFAGFNLPFTCWFVITKSHPWTMFVIVMCLHWSWVLGIAKGMTIEKYQLSYGQIMSLFAIIPPILSVAKLLRLRREPLGRFLVALPGYFIEGVRYLATGAPNPWQPQLYLNQSNLAPSNSDIEQQRTSFDPPNKLESPFPNLETSHGSHSSSVHVLDRHWWIVCGLWVFATVADVFWIFGYVEAGSIPNPRTPVNDPHKAWKPFSVSLYIYGYFVCYINILIWTTYYDKNISPWKGSLKRSQRMVLRIVRFICLPLAFVMCTGPLFSPFAALPLAQQWQWTHLCDSFSGEVSLHGITNPLQMPTISFYYPATEGIGLPFDYVYNYDLIVNASGNIYQADLVYNEPLHLSLIQPTITLVSYDTFNSTFSAYCRSNSTGSELCATGSWSMEPYLAFAINDLQTNSQIHLRAQDEEWKFSDDAPSVVLKYQNSTNHKLGDIALQSAVTQRNHCETLKVCLPSPAPDFATLVPLGILLMAQDIYAQFCLRPRIYSI